MILNTLLIAVADVWRRFTASRLAVAGLALALCSHATAQTQIAQIDNGEQRASVTRLSDEVLMGGYLPLRILIQNKTNRPQRWGVATKSSIDENRGSVLEFSQQFDVAANVTQIFDVLVPTPTLADFELARRQGFYYGYSTITVRGTLAGPNEERSFSCYSSGKTDYDSLLQGLGTRNGLDTVGYGREVKPYLPERYFEETRGFVPPHERYEIQLVELQTLTMQTDWRAYWGFGLISLSANELNALNPLQLQALMTWVRAGGALAVPDWIWLKGRSIQELTEDRFEKGVCFYGLGKIQVGPVGGVYSSVAKSVASEGSFPLSKKSVSGLFGYDLDGFASVGGYYFALIVFIVLVGPVNLMYFCRGRRRYRIFLTTPLIVAACLGSIALYSLLRDGVGGEGERYRLSIFGGESNQAIRIQTQGSRLGMIFDKAFRVPERAHVERFDIPAGARKIYRSEGTSRDGDWFVSRSSISQLIAWSEASREQVRLEGVSPSGEPVVSSRLKGRVSPFILKDRDGAFWFAESLSLGESKALSSIEEVEAKRYMSQLSKGKARRLYDTSMERVARGGGVFFGELKNDPALPLDTLATVDWEDGGHLAIGQVVDSRKEAK